MFCDNFVFVDLFILSFPQLAMISEEIGVVSCVSCEFVITLFASGEMILFKMEYTLYVSKTHFSPCTTVS